LLRERRIDLIVELSGLMMEGLTVIFGGTIMIIPGSLTVSLAFNQSSPGFAIIKGT
jgi:hypothetical protein